jgi:glycosyltransferase involved in cell wall biosynthesis
MLFTAISYFPDKPTGSARFTFELAREFADAGNNVYLLVMDVSSIGQMLQEDCGLTIIRYNNKTPRLAGFLKPWLNILRVRRALKRAIPNDVDIIHGNELMAYSSSIKYFKERSPTKVYTVHSSALEELNIAWRSSSKVGRLKCVLGLPYIKHLERKILTESDRITAESSYTLSTLQNIYGTELVEKCSVIPGWVDTERFNPFLDKAMARMHFGWPMDKPILFCLRRLVTRTGIDLLLEASKNALTHGYDFYLVIGGEGELRRVYENQAKEFGISESVHFLGRVAETDLPMAYAACDASIVPTRALEGFGIIVLESLACGRPVLATKVGALPELIGAFEPAWLADSDDVFGVANIIKKFLRGELPRHDPFELYYKVCADYSLSSAYNRFEGTYFS